MNNSPLPIVTLQLDAMASKIKYAIMLHDGEVHEYIAVRVKQEVDAFLPSLDAKIKEFTHSALLKEAESFVNSTVREAMDKLRYSKVEEW